MLGRQFPWVEAMLWEAGDDLPAFGPSVSHWRTTWPTDPLERPNKEIKRRTDVVRVIPNPARGWACRARAGRGPRRIAGLRPPLPLRGLHGPTHPARSDRSRTPTHQAERGDRPPRPADGIVSN